MTETVLVLPKAEINGYVRRGDEYLSRKDSQLWLADAELATTNVIAKEILRALRAELGKVRLG